MRGNRFAAGPFLFRISSNVASPNIPVLAKAAGWNGANRLIVDVTASLVNTLVFASDDTFPGGVLLRIGASSLVGGVRNGGAAIYTRAKLVIENSGKVYGGGGYGGAGQTVAFAYRSYSSIVCEGGDRSSGQGFANVGSVVVDAASPVNGGVYQAWGGAVFGGDSPPYGQGGASGIGGAWGDAGTSGLGGIIGGSSSIYFYGALDSPGAQGAYLDGAAFTTWAITGDRRGTSI